MIHCIIIPRKCHTIASYSLTHSTISTFLLGLQGQAAGAGPAFSTLSGGDHGARGQHEPQPGKVQWDEPPKGGKCTENAWGWSWKFFTGFFHMCFFQCVGDVLFGSAMVPWTKGMIDDVSYTTWLFVSSLGKAGWLQFEAGAHAHIMAQHSTEEMQIILYRAWALGKPRKTQKKNLGFPHEQGIKELGW